MFNTWTFQNVKNVANVCKIFSYLKEEEFHTNAISFSVGVLICIKTNIPGKGFLAIGYYTLYYTIDHPKSPEIEKTVIAGIFERGTGFLE